MASSHTTPATFKSPLLAAQVASVTGGWPVSKAPK